MLWRGLKYKFLIVLLKILIVFFDSVATSSFLVKYSLILLDELVFHANVTRVVLISDVENEFSITSAATHPPQALTSIIRNAKKSLFMHAS